MRERDLVTKKTSEDLRTGAKNAGTSGKFTEMDFLLKPPERI
jgi:hypothetical protein